MTPFRTSSAQIEHTIVITEEPAGRLVMAQVRVTDRRVNGQPTDIRQDPILGWYVKWQDTGLSAGWMFDERGQLITTHGVGALTASIAERDGLDPGAVLASVGSQFREAWLDYYGLIWSSLPGRPTAVGTSWVSEHQLSVLGGGGTLRGTWTVVGWESTEAPGRVRVRYEGSSGAVPLDAEVAAGIAQWVSVELPELAGQMWSTFTIDMNVDIVVEPTTLLTEGNKSGGMTLRGEAASASLQYYTESTWRWTE